MPKCSLNVCINWHFSQNSVSPWSLLPQINVHVATERAATAWAQTHLPCISSRSVYEQDLHKRLTGSVWLWLIPACGRQLPRHTPRSLGWEFKRGGTRSNLRPNTHTSPSAAASVAFSDSKRWRTSESPRKWCAYKCSLPPLRLGKKKLLVKISRRVRNVWHWRAEEALIGWEAAL